MNQQSIQERIAETVNRRSFPRNISEPENLDIGTFKVFQHQEIDLLSACSQGRPMRIFKNDDDFDDDFGPDTWRSIVPSFEIARVISIPTGELDDDTLLEAADEVAEQIANEENERMAHLLGFLHRQWERQRPARRMETEIKMAIRTPITVVPMGPGEFIIYEEIALYSVEMKDSSKEEDGPVARFIHSPGPVMKLKIERSQDGSCIDSAWDESKMTE